MKKYFLIYFLLPFTVYAQSGAEITALDFPYKAGYNMRFTGTQHGRLYEKNGDYRKYSIDFEFNYKLDSQYVKGGDTIVNFHVTNIVNGDTDVVNSPLFINSEGMFFDYSPEIVRDITKLYENKVDDTIRCQMIKTPMSIGSTWTSYDHTILPTSYTCFVLDTLIETPAGSFHAFGIRTSRSVTQLTGKMKKYRMETELITYYAQGIGKIYETTKSYIIRNKDGSVYIFTANEYSLDEFWQDE